jgi:hypothetical protein
MIYWKSIFVKKISSLAFFCQIIPIFHEKGDVMAEETVGCARVTGSVSGGESAPTPTPQSPVLEERKETLMTARVGQKAPDFTAPAYYKGGFTSVKLSDFAGKWTMVCFYPGDFTFV